MKVKCIRDTEGYWSEGEMYSAIIVTGGFIQVGDDITLKDGALSQWNTGKTAQSFVRL